MYPINMEVCPVSEQSQALLETWDRGLLSDHLWLHCLAPGTVSL